MKNVNSVVYYLLLHLFIDLSSEHAKGDDSHCAMIRPSNLFSVITW